MKRRNVGSVGTCGRCRLQTEWGTSLPGPPSNTSVGEIGTRSDALTIRLGTLPAPKKTAENHRLLQVCDSERRRRHGGLSANVQSRVGGRVPGPGPRLRARLPGPPRDSRLPDVCRNESQRRGANHIHQVVKEREKRGES